jgi:hypothetical protein
VATQTTVTAIMMTISEVRQSRRLGIAPRHWASVRHHRAVALSPSCEETIRQADRAARSLGWKVRSVDTDGRKMTVATRMSWPSWGERVTVTARPMGTGCGVEVSSRPALPLNVIDGGTNFVNVRQMIALLTLRPTDRTRDRRH